MTIALRAFLTCLLLTVVSLIVGVLASGAEGAKPSRAAQVAVWALIVFGTGMGLCLVWMIWS